MKVSAIITLKKDVLDPQGKVIHQTLDGMGFKDINEVNNQLEENCDSTSGQIGQITGWDEGQCQDGRDSRDLLSSLQYSLLLGGVALSSTGVFMLVRY